MDAVRPEFVPDPSLSRNEMEQLQRDIAAAAVFEDDVGEVLTTALEDSFGVDSRPLVAGVDQGFHDDDATSAIVVMRDGTVVERVHATERTEIPYIPGLLSFREGGAILSAFERLECDPDVVLVDGSGRIHFREAGLATHVGVTLDVPAVGVAKSLLCGRPRQPIEQGLPEGTRVAIEADGDVTASAGTVIGYAVQTCSTTRRIGTSTRCTSAPATASARRPPPTSSPDTRPSTSSPNLFGWLTATPTRSSVVGNGRSIACPVGSHRSDRQ